MLKHTTIPSLKESLFDSTTLTATDLSIDKDLTESCGEMFYESQRRYTRKESIEKANSLACYESTRLPSDTKTNFLKHIIRGLKRPVNSFKLHKGEFVVPKIVKVKSINIHNLTKKTKQHRTSVTKSIRRTDNSNIFLDTPLKAKQYESKKDYLAKRYYEKYMNKPKSIYRPKSIVIMKTHF